ncbi:MAG TPA: ribonuclease III [Candidatus Limnocylindrales bacterium]
MTSARDLASRLGLPFSDFTFLEQALVHSSYVHEQPSVGASNERLEFLGDAVISVIVSEALFERYPDDDEGSLTTRRAAIVSARGLSRIAQRLELGSYLLLGLGASSADERSRKSVLAATFEAVCGAVYLEFGLARTKRWLRKVAEPELAAQGAVDDLKPAKSVLQERAYAKTGRAPHYELLSDDGPPHARHYVVEVRIGGLAMGRGEGRSRREAETEAATLALVALDAEAKQPGSRT